LLGLTTQRLGRFRPLGDTDSEYAFCLLLEQVAQEGQSLADEESWSWLHHKLSLLNRHGKLNCLLSDGRRLFCYHDQAGHKGLSLRRIRVSADQLRSFGDSELQVDLQASDQNEGHAVATHPLSVSGWHRFHPGELIVLAGGALAYSSHRRHGQESAAPREPPAGNKATA
jgi:glutamine amidotransferase